jgi:hypothetical protein
MRNLCRSISSIGSVAGSRREMTVHHPSAIAALRLRITPSPYHYDALIEAFVDVWRGLGLPLKKRALPAK